LAQLSSVIRTSLFGIDDREVEFATRGFSVGDPGAALHLERVGGFFVAGYRAALDDPDPAALAGRLEALPAEFRGFAYEGAGMALALLDRLAPWRRDRLRVFLAGPGEPHTYMLTIGAGWTLGRLRLGPRGLLRSLDPVTGWLALDGYGFHEGYFHPARTIDAGIRPARLKGYAKRAFDTGVGRSLWFVAGADPERLAQRIRRFEPSRQAELWAGCGLACSYAGGVGDDVIARLIELAGPLRGALAQGAAFAAKARLRASNPTEHTRRAVEQICSCPVELAAKLCDRELTRLLQRPDEPAASGDADPLFERWRVKIRQSLERGFAQGAGGPA
jgi:hypothetical protein